MEFESKEHHKAWYETTPAGRRYANASEAAQEADRIWFEDHPTAFCYLRPRRENEQHPSPDEAVNDMVLVAQITPGLRVRISTTEANYELAMVEAVRRVQHIRAELGLEPLRCGEHPADDMPAAQSRQQRRKAQREADKALQRAQKGKGAMP